MASPQKEHGYTAIANEILEQIAKTVLSGTKYRIVIVVWRFTYGFNRKKYKMSTQFIADAIGSDRSHVWAELKELQEQNILIIHSDGPRRKPEITFNKNYDEWTSSIPDKTKKVLKKDAALPSKPKVMKKAKPKKLKYEEDNTYYKAALYFHKKVSKVANEAGIAHLINKANMQTWADDMRKLLEIDKIEKRLLKEVMDWVVTDNFWKTNILSARKLREKFPELAVKMKSKQTPQQESKQSPSKDPRDRDIALQQWIEDGNDPEDFKY